MSEYNLYLNGILRAIHRIENSVKNKDFEKFKQDDIIDATSMRLQIIGESIRKLDAGLKRKYKLNWEKYLQTRNIISHAYFAVNPKILWSIIKKDIPKLKKVIKKIIQKEK
ncbi:MAG: DUF86 domain-containing protein [Candidatus Pacearchaeota archaeon]|jgi:uncharacterized protein with HEPN domain